MSLTQRLRDLKTSYEEDLIDTDQYETTKADLLKAFATGGAGKLW
jgi:hypothetical protein